MRKRLSRLGGIIRLLWRGGDYFQALAYKSESYILSYPIKVIRELILKNAIYRHWTFFRGIQVTAGWGIHALVGHEI